MARLSCESEPDGKTTYNTAFIDTNLDTHLAMMISDVDTVSDLKNRIQSEHSLCFPKFGKIHIHAVKVKRKGYFYHLSDSMFVRSAFDRFSKSWFLSIDASALEEHGKNQNSLSPGSNNQVACIGIANNASIGAVDVPLSPSCLSKRVSNFNNYLLPQLENGQDNEEVPFFSPCVSEHTGKEVVKDKDVKPSNNSDPEIPSPGLIRETQDHFCVNHELPSSHIEYEVDGSSKAIKDEWNVCDESTLEDVPSANKKHKRKNRRKKGRVQDNMLIEKNSSVLGPGKDTVEQDILVPENASQYADKGVRIGENNNVSRLGCSGIEMSNETLKETEGPKQHTECNNKNTKNGIDTKCYESTKQASEPRPAMNKMHKKSKRSLTHDSKQEILKVESTSQKAEVQKSDEVCKESEDPKDQVEFIYDKPRNGIEFQHSKASEEASHTKPPAKKNQKGKERSGDESALKEKISMISDCSRDTLKPDSSSQHSLEDQQKIKCSNPDQSTEHFDDTDPPKARLVGGKRKRKKNLSNIHQTDAVPSRNDVAALCSRIQGEGVQEDLTEDGQISKDISMSKTAVDTMEVRVDACIEGIPPKKKRAVDSKSHRDIDMKVHSDANEPVELTEDNKLSTHENSALDHCHKSEAASTKQAKEGREISLQNDSKLMLSEKCTPSNQDSANVNIGVLDVDGVTVPGKSEKKRRKIRKTKDLGGGPALREGIDNVDASESNFIFVNSHNATNCNSISGNVKKEDNLLNQTEGENAHREEMKGTLLSGTDRGVDHINADDAGFLELSSKAQAKAENMEEKKGKKSKKKQASTAKSHADVLTKDHVLDHKKPLPSTDRALVEPSLKIRKKNKSTSAKSTKKLSGSNLDHQRDPVGIDPPHSQINSGSPGSSQVPSNATEANCGVDPSEANDTAKDLAHFSGDENDNHLEAPSKSDKINADQHFASGQQQHEAVASDDMPVENTNGAERTDIDLITEKNKHRLEAPKGKTRAITGSLRTTEQLYSEDEGDGFRSQPDKKVPKIHRIGQEAQLSSQSNSISSTIEENRLPGVVKAPGKTMQLEKKREPFSVSNSKTRGSEKIVRNKAGKASENNFGGVAINTEQNKRLLAGEIFKNDSSSEDEDEDAVDLSNASTRTPSDNSFSSDYSDGESNAGSYGGKGLENGGRSAIKARLSGTKGMNFDSILRSSSRYKKAKMTASQLEETESQPIDIVPDSQANL